MSEITEIEIKSMTKEQNYFKGYSDGKNDILDKIRTEIVNEIEEEYIPYTGGYIKRTLDPDTVIAIIDKYMSESKKL